MPEREHDRPLGFENPEYKDHRTGDHRLTPHDFEKIAQIISEHPHVCFLTDEEKQLIKDMATGGKALKKAMIYIFAGLALLAVVSENTLRKVTAFFGSVFK